MRKLTEQEEIKLLRAQNRTVTAERDFEVARAEVSQMASAIEAGMIAQRNFKGAQENLRRTAMQLKVATSEQAGIEAVLQGNDESGQSGPHEVKKKTNLN